MGEARAVAGRWVLLVACGWLPACGAFAQTQPLNDTGQLTCFDSNGSPVGDVAPATPTPNPATLPGQDCTQGRSAADALGRLAKQGGSAYRGRDQTKISNSGQVLPVTAVEGDGPDDWGCTRDNVTGLIWEAKSTTGGLRDIGWTYSWFDADGSRNGGVAGTVAAGASCGDILPACTTTAYRDAVNALPAAQRVCGASDWRLPSVHELRSLLVSSVFENEGFDSFYLRLAIGRHFTSQSVVQQATDAWCVDLQDAGVTAACAKSSTQHVVLVRGTP